MAHKNQDSAIVPLSTPQHSQWDPRLIAKYDVAAPRYTSYPTALEFNTDFDSDCWRSEVIRQGVSIAPLSLYVHIPFCENICYYCACNKVITRQRERTRAYLNHLFREISLQAELVGNHRPVTQLHWGGGTPTFLSPAEMTELMHVLASHFHLLDTPQREYAIEIDPRTVQKETLALLKGLGFNRISFGIQDFDPAVQQAINRIQSTAQITELVEAARGFGFKSISFDLIYGLPLQTEARQRKTLDQVLTLAPDRIALYNYAHLPERFPHQRAIARHQLPDAQTKIALLIAASERLTSAGYRHVGMDHFVLPNDELAQAQDQGRLQRNFQGYSTCMAPDLLGLGVSAISSLEQCYAQNSRNLKTYGESLAEGRLAIERGCRVNPEDQLRRYVIMQLICQLQVNLAEVSARFGLDASRHFRNEVAALTPFVEDGLVLFDGNILRVTGRGRPMLRNLCMMFDRYRHPSRQSATAISKAL